MCDGSDILYELKVDLLKERTNYKIIVLKQELYNNLLNQLYNISPERGNMYSEESYYNHNIERLFFERNQSFNKVVNLRDSIIKLEPNFQ